MKIYRLRLAVVISAAFIPGMALAQLDAHQAATPGSGAASGDCARVQPLVDNIIAAAMMRVESARQSNSPSQMRAAVDHLEASFRDIRAQLEPCKMEAAAVDPHAGHVMPAAPAGATTAPAPKPAPKPAPETPATKPAADPHAGHAMPAAPAAPKSAPSSNAPQSKPEAPAADPHAGHSSTLEAGKQMDPVNGLMVDPASAPTTTYEGATYYFSSEQSRKEFLASPAKFAKKPKA